MAKHRKQSKGKQIRNLLILGLALCAAAGIAVGVASVANLNDTAASGIVLSDRTIYDREQYLLPQPNGGFLLVSADGIGSTNAMFLTQSGAVAEGSNNYRSISGDLQRVLVKNGTAYLTVSGADVGRILCIPLNGSQFSNTKELVFANTARQIDLKTISVDSAGRCYAIERSSNRVLCLNFDDIEQSVPLCGFSDGTVTLQSLAVDGDMIYLRGENSVWSGTLYQNQILGLSQQSNVSVNFPVEFLSSQLVMDETCTLYTLSNGRFSAAASDDFIGDAVLTESGNFAAVTDRSEISLYRNGNYTTPISTYRFDGTIRALAYNGGIGVLLSGDSGYRSVILSESELLAGNIGQEPSSQLPADTPIHQKPTVSDPSDSSDEEFPSDGTDRIISSQYDVDSAAGSVTVPAGTTLAQFRKTVSLNNATLTAVTAEGDSAAAGRLGTGMRLQLHNSEELLDEIVVIVKGDTNGNGAVNSADEKLLYQHLTGEYLLTDIYYTASDLDENGAVNTRDLLLLKQRHQ